MGAREFLSERERMLVGKLDNDQRHVFTILRPYMERCQSMLRGVDGEVFIEGYGSHRRAVRGGRDYGVFPVRLSGELYKLVGDYIEFFCRDA